MDEHGVSTTLVATIKRGLNDGELGRMIDLALGRPCVRGITLQPVQHAGRTRGFDPATDRLTLTEVRRRILEQSDLFLPEDILPVPCHPDAIAMAYALKTDGRVAPLSSWVDPSVLVSGGGSTIAFEREPGVRERLFAALSAGHSPTSGAATMRDLLCCLPEVDLGAGLSYENLFRVLIVQFADAHAFDVRSVKKSCIHVVHPEDGRVIPLDTYNLFYRDGLEKRVLGPLQRARRSAVSTARGSSSESP